MRGLRLVSIAVILLASLAWGDFASEAQAAERIMYFATKTTSGRQTRRPYSNCRIVEMGSRTLWACPTQAARNSPNYERSDKQDRGDSGRSSNSSDSGGNSGGGDTGGGMGGGDGGGGMGGDGGDGGGM